MWMQSEAWTSSLEKIRHLHRGRNVPGARAEFNRTLEVLRKDAAGGSDAEQDMARRQIRGLNGLWDNLERINGHNLDTMWVE
ncbi:MAG: hypothetical protein J4432_02210 [DPANN group archaeon]|nr:hypothetical protein [DPANN group archaeon]